jgi:hypothetical protein
MLVWGTIGRVGIAALFIFAFMLTESVFATEQFPIKAGVYVDKNVLCDNSPLANFASYADDPSGLSFSKLTCVIMSVRADGMRYSIMQDCVSAEDDTSTKFLKEFVIDVVNNQEFSFGRDTYRYCRNFRN